MAFTLGPGLAPCLQAALAFSREVRAFIMAWPPHPLNQFASQHTLPLVPVHHMEAHALTPRLQQEVSVRFPCLVLLVLVLVVVLVVVVPMASPLHKTHLGPVPVPDTACLGRPLPAAACRGYGGMMMQAMIGCLKT